MSADEQKICGTLLDDAAVMIDAYNVNATDEAKTVVSCRMVVRAMATDVGSTPIGATQGSMSALGYSQSWTIGASGATGELYLRTVAGVDALNAPIYTETAVTVDNVLVAPVSADEVLQTYTLTGRKAVYQMAIPKGDANDWTAGKRVSFFGQDWRIIELPEEGIEALIPLAWNKKVKVERYEQG